MAIVVFAAIVFGVSLIVMPHYVTTAQQAPPIEEALAPQTGIAGAALTPKGMAAATLAPTENLNSPLGGEPLRSR
jgi:hypothetical protein